MAIQIGDKLPNFKATKQDGTAFDSHEKILHQVVLRKHVVLETPIKIFKI
jgi:peroxiredoxin